jgi:transcriptional regulator with XRE-family HTH domain
MANEVKVSYLADRIRRARKEAGFSQDELGEILGVSDKTISAYEVGRAVPPFFNLMKLAKLTQKPISYFSDESPETQLEIEDRLQIIEKLLMEIKELLINKDLSARAAR